MRNLPPFEKSWAENDELAAVSKAPIRQPVESRAKDTPMGQCAPRWAEVARRVLVPSDEWQLTRSVLDGYGYSSHYGRLCTAGMGKKCRHGFSDGGISHIDARTCGIGSTLGAFRITCLAVCVRQDPRASTGASRCNRRGRSPRCLWDRTPDVGSAGGIEAVFRRTRDAAVSHEQPY